MNIEVREDSVVVTGYVNAVERYSKPILANLRGKMRKFVEKIKAGVFGTALKRNNNVKVLLNHDPARELANTLEGTAKLEEDNIGLRAEVTITDAEVVDKAKNNKLIGWSFGFYSNADDVNEDGEMATRTVHDMDLVEVSILDDTKSPAYYGTSIETRCEDDRELEIRATVEEIESEAQAQHEAINNQEKLDWKAIEDQHKAIDMEATKKKMELFAQMVADLVVEKLNLVNVVGMRATDTEEAEATEENTATEATEATEENTEAEEAKETEERRAVDYSDWEKRLAELK